MGGINMFESIREARKNESGFTLIELLIVIVILGVLAAIVVFAVGGFNDTSKQSACASDGKSVETAVEAWYAANKNSGSDYPATQVAAQAAVVPGFLHSWPASTDYKLTYAYVAAAGATPSTFTVTGKLGAAGAGAPCYP
jgi:general secretion pathway protein G